MKYTFVILITVNTYGPIHIHTYIIVIIIFTLIILVIVVDVVECVLESGTFRWGVTE